jgi:hypothetical protein
MVRGQIFVVRIYHRSRRYRVAGTVELVHSGKELTFRNFKELQAILTMAPPGPKTGESNGSCAKRKA